MNKKNRTFIACTLSIVSISIIFFSLQYFQTSEKSSINNINTDYDPGGQRVNWNTDIFSMYSYQEDWDILKKDFNFIWVEKKINYDYSKIESKNENTAFIIPVFTNSAYWSPGFYDFYRNECDELCLTTPIKYDMPFNYESSRNAIQVLSLLGYDQLTDLDVTTNPDILTKYDKIILLHNEYVTKKEYDAITAHPKVIYLYPNSLYAQVEFDQENNSITLIQGHGYPEETISNGFGWEFENTHPYEFDVECIDWEFYEISNGFMLNCYPERLILNDESLLIFIRDL